MSQSLKEILRYEGDVEEDMCLSYQVNAFSFLLIKLLNNGRGQRALKISRLCNKFQYGINNAMLHLSIYDIIILF